MQSWYIDISLTQLLIDFSLMSLLLVAATWLRRYSKTMQQFLIPANLIAGFLGLIAGFAGLTWGFLDSERLGAYVYHLLALLFIAISLRSPRKSLGNSPVKFSIIFIICYLMQALVGLSLALLLIFTIMPDLFAGIGMLLPLAFGMNPGIAFSFGQAWELHGFQWGGTVGLSFGAMGFVVAYTVGIISLRKGVLRGEAAFIRNPEQLDTVHMRDGIYPVESSPALGRQTSTPEVVGSLSLHLGFIGLTYALTYALLLLISALLTQIGAEKEIPTIWSFHFILAAIMALLVRRVIDMSSISHWVDDDTMTHSGNLFMDYMVVASVSAITLAVVGMYWLPLLLLGGTVAFATWFTVRMATKSLFGDYRLERYVSIFGNMTGSMQSALVLLRVLDPEFKSPVSYDLIYGSGLTLALGFPLLLLINAPVNYFENSLTGYIMVMLGMALYLAIFVAAWRYMNNKPGST